MSTQIISSDLLWNVAEIKAKGIVQDAFAKVWSIYEEVSFEKAKRDLFTAAFNTIIEQSAKILE